MIRIEVPGQPVAKGRAKFAVINGQAHAYTPAKTVHYEAGVAMMGKAAMAGKQPLEGPLSVTLFAQFMTPKRGKKDGDYHTGRPDADNLAKAANDALNGIVWRDDAQIASMQVIKTYANSPKLVIEVRAL